MKGTASDDNNVARIEYKTPGSKFTKARGTRRWKVRTLLLPGRNVIRIRAVDAAGQRSKVQRVKVIQKD